MRYIQKQHFPIEIYRFDPHYWQLLKTIFDFFLQTILDFLSFLVTILAFFGNSRNYFGFITKFMKKFKNFAQK